MAIRFEKLLQYLARLPAIKCDAGPESIVHTEHDDGNWHVAFDIDTDHELAWRHVQELGYVLNDLSLGERLPVSFKPVSPPPYLNGGVEFLYWVIESEDLELTPRRCAEWLEGRLPRPVEDLEQWRI